MRSLLRACIFGSMSFIALFAFFLGKIFNLWNYYLLHYLSKSLYNIQENLAGKCAALNTKLVNVETNSRRTLMKRSHHVQKLKSFKIYLTFFKRVTVIKVYRNYKNVKCFKQPSNHSSAPTVILVFVLSSGHRPQSAPYDVITF